MDIPTYTLYMDESNSSNQFDKCGECGPGNRRKKALVQHIRSKHKGVKYSCDRCEYQATEKGDLKKHKQAIHEGIKYPCNECEYQATWQRCLKKHKQSQHKDPRC